MKYDLGIRNSWSMIVFLFFIFLMLTHIANKNPTCEKFSPILKNSENIIPTKYQPVKYSHKYDIIKINETAYDILEKCKLDSEFTKTLNKSMVEIYKEIKNNSDLKNYLVMMNLISDDGFPLFINKGKEMLLFNEIKIQLIIQTIRT